MKKYFFVVFFIVSCCVFAQNPTKELKYFETKYPQAQSVEVVRKQQLQIKITDGKPEIYYERYFESILLTDFVSNFTTEKVYYSPIDTLVEIEAWTLQPNGNQYKKIPVKSFEHSFDFQDYVFFDDSKVCKFVFPSLSKGCKIVYRVKKKLNDPHFIPSFFFSNVDGVERSEIVFEYDPSVEMKFNEIGIKKDLVHTEKKVKKNEIIIRKTMENILPLKFESNVNNYLIYLPHILPVITSYKATPDGEEIQNLPSPEYLNKLYQSYIDEIPPADESGLQHLADSLVAGAKTESDKVKAIYYWVQHNIRYIAIEDGRNGVVPENAVSVYEKRFGDCKGKANLTHKLLEKAGVRTYLTWIGTSDLPYKYSEIPSPATDNHMILTYIDSDGKCYFLDATDEFQNIYTAPVHLQGKECLIGINKDSFRIEEIPRYRNNVIHKMSLKIRNTDLDVKDTLLLSGSTQKEYAYKFSHVTEEQKRKNYINELSKNDHAKNTVNAVTTGNIYDVDNDLQVIGDYVLHDYVMKSSDNLYLKPFLRGLAPVFTDENRIFEFELKEKQYQSWEQTVTVPEGYKVSHLVNNVNIKDDLFSFSAEMTENNDLIKLKIDYLTDFIRLPREKYEEWNNMNKQIQRFLNQSIVLVKK